jgi:hypothetical protein
MCVYSYYSSIAMYDDHLVASFPPLTIYIRLTIELFVLPLRNEAVPTFLVCRNEPIALSDSRSPAQNAKCGACGLLTSLLELHAPLPELHGGRI